MGPRADLVCQGQLIRAIILPHHHFMVMMAINSLAPECKWNSVCVILKDILITDTLDFSSLIPIRLKNTFDSSNGLVLSGNMALLNQFKFYNSMYTHQV